MNNETAISRIHKVAQIAFLEAIDCGATIKILSEGNGDSIANNLEKLQADLAAGLVQKALFGRLLITVMTAFDPVRKGDFHLRVAIELLTEPVIGILTQHGSDAELLGQALELWNQCLVHPQMGELRNYRNKEAVHLSDRPESVRDPLIGELLELANMMTRVCELLANGLKMVDLSLESQVLVYEKSARQFWKPWK
jgi:hypothetical protein